MKHLEFRRRILSFAKSEELDPDLGDRTDRPSFSEAEKELLKEDKEPVECFSVLLTFVSMCTYTLDITSSAVVCFWLYQTGHWWWYMMVVPLVASLLVINIFSMRWYIHDAQEEKEHLPAVSVSHWVFRVVFHVCLIGPVIRYLELFLYGIHTMDRNDKDRAKYRMMFLQEDRDISLLVMVGSFMKSAPQLVLQMYILTQSSVPLNLETVRAQAVNLVSALVELSLSQSAYHRALRRSSPSKHNMTKLGAFVQFLSHCCVIGSRVLALAAFASQFRHWIFVFCAIHWTIMTSWLIMQRTTFCASSLGHPRLFEELVFNVIIAGIYLFCFINVKDEPTRWKYTIYYFIIWIENVVLSTLWFLKVDPGVWYRIPLLTCVIASLAAGLMFLILYYQFLHPNKIWSKLDQTLRSSS